MVQQQLKYPIGVQSFEIIRRTGCLYVDKTEYIHTLANSGSRVFFLSRPRRFGKSLLLSTMEAFFQGRKELFAGLKIYDLEEQWTAYPVLHFDLSRAEGTDPDKLTAYIKVVMHQYADDYHIQLRDDDMGIGPQFGFLIQDIYQSTGQEVVILIDEYDKGIIETLENEDNLRRNQETLRPFFSQIKAQGQYIRFSFITGVSRFRHYTLFSGFNNPNDISLSPKYSAICGITFDELTSIFAQGIDEYAAAHQLTTEQVVGQLTQKYDGYRFSSANVLLFNPFSIINCLENQELRNYWIKSGTPKAFIDYLGNADFELTELESLWCTANELEGAFSSERPIPLLFQTGYLTIKDFDNGLYRLGIPNGEVKSALVDDLMPHMMAVSERKWPRTLSELSKKIKNGDVNGFMADIQTLIAKVPFHQFDYSNQEKTYHLLIYQIFLIIGIDARSEISMSGGRIDMVAETDKYVYVMEYKLGGTPDEALAQIDDRGYAIPWHSDRRKVIKIGVVFSPETRTISCWKTQMLS